MPDALNTDFSLATNIVNKFISHTNPVEIANSAARLGGSNVASDLINKYRKTGAIIPDDWAAALRRVETDPRWKDWSVGDIKDKSKWAAYEKLSTQERYARRPEFKSWGPLQIGEKVIEDVNLAYGTDYTHEDVFDRRAAVEILRLYVARWSKKGDSPEQMIRRWSGGPTGDVDPRTLEHWYRVKAEYDKLQKLKTVKQ